MNEQQPHLEILSRNRVNRSTIIVAVIPVSLFSGALIYAIWPFLTWIAIGVLTLAVICALYLVALLAIDVRRRWINAHVIHLGEYGVVDAMGWRMLPLALPAPVVTEVLSLPDERPAHVSLDHWRILQLAGKGMDLRSVALACNTTYYQVQKITSQWDALMKKQVQVDRSSTAS